jgi:hypothetical protein
VNPTSTTTALTDLLAAAVAAFDQEGANTAPAIQFISHSQPITYGTDQLAVWTPGIRRTKPFPLTALSAVDKTVIPGLDLIIELWRSCWPGASVSAASKSLPAPQDITTAATTLANDAAALFGHISTLIAAGTLFPSLPTIRTSSDVSLSPLVALPPQGSLAGWRFPLALKLAIP